MQQPKPPDDILETILYVEDLEAAEDFYTRVLGLQVYAKSRGRQVFFKLGRQMLLIFNPLATVKPPKAGANLPVPPHGARGQGHVCFAASGEEIVQWKARLEAAGIGIEADFHWPSGGRSIYFRDPAGNALEFAEPNIWGF
jgi:catechol 2,3-dioxygenase-like lactoylglutathione lyase family enzyme